MKGASEYSFENSDQFLPGPVRKDPSGPFFFLGSGIPVCIGSYGATQSSLM